MNMEEHFDDSTFEKFSADELLAALRHDNRLMWGRRVCVTGWLRVMKYVSFLSEGETSEDAILCPGPTLDEALRGTAWSLFGGVVRYEGPASIWFVGVRQSRIPHIGVVGMRPVRLSFTCRPSVNGETDEPVEIPIPQPTKKSSAIEVLGIGDCSSLVRLEDHFTTAMLLHRPDLLASCYVDADKLHSLARQLWSMDKESPVLQDLSRWSGSICEMLKILFAEYERFAAQHDVTLGYSPPISERQCPSSES